MARYALIGKMGERGVESIALSEEDRHARDLLLSQMMAAGLEIHIDQIGNMIGIRKGEEDLPPVAFGSHLDTVYSGGRYDGALGVLAGLEVIHTLNDHHIKTKRPLALINFTNEEGVRFAPDMMGSHVYAGLSDLDEILKSQAYDDPEETVGSRLETIKYNGQMRPGSIAFDSFFELHIEQGPVLEQEGIEVGVVESVQSIHWTQYTLKGEANHAGTTPNLYRKDAGLLAAELIQYVGELSRKDDQPILTTVGNISFTPNTINIIPGEVSFTLDLRSTDARLLEQIQQQIDKHFYDRANAADIGIHKKKMVRFQPVRFPKEMPDLVERTAIDLGLTTRRMPSGAGHDAQMMASFCPSTMIFIPSVKGISHNIEEYSKDEDVANGAQVLFDVVLEKAAR